jgi:hypothetical protein
VKVFIKRLLIFFTHPARLVEHREAETVRMKLAVALVFVLSCCAAFSTPKRLFSEAVDTKPGRRVTLLSHRKTAKSDNYDKTIVSFRPHSIYVSARNRVKDHDLRFGGLNYLGDKDWLQVANDRTRWSRIRDLGEMDWSDEIEVPVLPSLPCRTNEPCGRIVIPPRNSGKKIQDEDVNPHIAKPQVGHMYLVHRVRDRRASHPPQGYDELFDYYVLVRVEDLKPNESCTITWKRVSLPKKQTH